MNVLMETNKMLREEKEKMEQELKDTQAKASHTILSIIFASWNAALKK